MQRDEALALLREHKDEIVTRYHVKHLALFGSMARNEAREESDVDLLVDFEGPAMFDGYIDFQFFLGNYSALVSTLVITPPDLPLSKGEGPADKHSCLSGAVS